MWGYDGGWHGGWWGFGMLHMALYWGVLILAIALLVKWLFGRASGGSSDRQPGKTALDILKERYARGEIGKEEFDQKKRDLEA